MNKAIVKYWLKRGVRLFSGNLKYSFWTYSKKGKINGTNKIK